MHKKLIQTEFKFTECQGGHIPQSNAVDYPLDPQAIPIKVEGKPK